MNDLDPENGKASIMTTRLANLLAGAAAAVVVVV